MTALNRLTAEQGKQLEARVVELKAENGQIKSDANQQKSELGIVQSRMDASDAEHALTQEVLLGVRFSSSSPDMCIQIKPVQYVTGPKGPGRQWPCGHDA